MWPFYTLTFASKGHFVNLWWILFWFLLEYLWKLAEFQKTRIFSRITIEGIAKAKLCITINWTMLKDFRRIFSRIKCWKVSFFARIYSKFGFKTVTCRVYNSGTVRHSTVQVKLTSLTCVKWILPKTCHLMEKILLHCYWCIILIISRNKAIWRLLNINVLNRFVTCSSKYLLWVRSPTNPIFWLW